MIREVLTSAQLRAMAPDEAAALWTVRLAEEPLPHERELFEEWLQSDDANAAAWERAQHSWTLFDGAQDDELLAAMRLHARAARPPGRQHWSRFAAAAALVIAVGTGSLLAERQGLFGGAGTSVSEPSPVPRPQLASARVDYVNGRALPRLVTLPDGSQMTLDAQTHVAVLFSPNRRSLQLVNGRAFFAVQHDSSRPFVVRAGALNVMAIGTRFDVRLAPKDIRVSLVEGRLRVTSTGSHPQTLMMTRGQQLDARDGAAPNISHPPMDEALGWQQGFATFKDETLAQAAAELNRYPGDRLVVRDPRISGLRVTGMFKAGNAERFGETVEQIYPVRVVRRNSDQLEIVPAG
jgi:transmembrane sensor